MERELSDRELEAVVAGKTAAIPMATALTKIAMTSTITSGVAAVSTAKMAQSTTRTIAGLVTK